LIFTYCTKITGRNAYGTSVPIFDFAVPKVTYILAANKNIFLKGHGFTMLDP